MGPLDVHAAAPEGLGRLSIDKDFVGDIVGTSRGEMVADVTVVPGSATCELTGMTGSMVIDAANNHAYEFDYLLAE